MNKKQEFNEIIELLIWSYKQGYLHASHVLKDTVPDDAKLGEMFKEALDKRQASTSDKS